jgi:hypothetical protein
MTESEEFWISVLDLLDDDEPLDPKLDPNEITSEDAPAWVTKLAAEVLTMVMPPIQLRIGDRPTPEKVGALIGNHLALSETVMDGSSPLSAGFQALLQSAKPLLGGFDGVAAVQEMAERRPRAQKALVRVIAKVLERPDGERYGFFRAFTRGIRPAKISSESRPLTAAEKKRLNTLAVYGVALTNWRKLDRLKTSREAYDFLVKLLSVDVVGHDPERIRRMFARVGKRFGAPGRPSKAK